MMKNKLTNKISFNDFNRNTIPQMLCKRATYSPNDLAYCFPELHQTCTWSELFWQVRTLSEGFLNIGVKKGDRVAMLMENRIEMILSMYAAASIGAIAVPINTYSKKEELKTYLLDAKPVVLIIGAKGQHLHYPVLVREILSEANMDLSTSWMPANIFVVQGNLDDTAFPFHQFSELFSDDSTMDNHTFLKSCNSTYADDPVFLIYTSGTTGFPRGIERSTASFLAIGNNQSNFSNKIKSVITRAADLYTNRYSLMCLLPLYHMGGIGLLFTTLKVCNVRTVILTHYNPFTALNVTEKEKCHFLVGTPFMIQHMLASKPPGKNMLDSVLGLAFASAAVNSAIIERITGGLKNLYFFTVSYGSSEAGAVSNGTCIFNNNSNVMVSLFLKILRGAKLLNGEIKYEEFTKTPYSIGGKVDKNVEVAIIDLQTGDFIQGGTEGEIVIRSHRVMRYVHENMARTSFLQDGWYKSGDIGYLDDKRNLIISGRIKRLISRGGEKISPVEIENVLLRNPGVMDAFVVGIPDDLYGEQVCAAFVAAPGAILSFEKLREDVSSSLSQFKVPKYFVSLPEFPLSPTGKISSGEIKKLVIEKINELNYA